MQIANLTIGTRLNIGFGVMLSMLVGITVLGITGIRHANENLNHIVDVNVYKISLLQEMTSATHVVARVLRTIALLPDGEQGQLEHRKIDAARAKYNAAYDLLEKMPLDEAGRTLVRAIKEDQVAARTLNDQFADMAKTNKDEATQFLLKRAAPATSKWQDAIAAFSDLQKAKS